MVLVKCQAIQKNKPKTTPNLKTKKGEKTMKKRKSIILSAITCFVSICLLMFGVYAASNPSVSISGQVSYSARDVSVLVQGATVTDGGQIQFEKNAPSDKIDLLKLSKSSDLQNTPSQYFDWTQGEKSGDSIDQNETLASWNIGNLDFQESSSGVAPIKIGFRIKNYSNYPIRASINFFGLATDKDLTDANLVRNITGLTNGKVLISQFGNVEDIVEIEICYNVLDSSKKVKGENYLGMKLTLERSQSKTIQFQSNGGSEVNSIEYDGTAFDVLPTPSKTDNQFVGWYLDKDLTEPVEYPFVPTGNITLYAKWSKNLLVTFDSNGGTSVTSQIANDLNPTISKPTDPTFAEKIFSGWYLDKNWTEKISFPYNPSKSITLYARWQCRVTVDYGDVQSSQSFMIDDGEEFSLPQIPQKDCHDIGKWNNEYESGTKVTITSNRQFLAQWTPWVVSFYNGMKYDQYLDADGNATGFYDEKWFGRVEVNSAGYVVPPENPTSVEFGKIKNTSNEVYSLMNAPSGWQFLGWTSSQEWYDEELNARGNGSGDVIDFSTWKPSKNHEKVYAKWGDGSITITITGPQYGDFDVTYYDVDGQEHTERGVYSIKVKNNSIVTISSNIWSGDVSYTPESNVENWTTNGSGCSFVVKGNVTLNITLNE